MLHRIDEYRSHRAYGCEFTSTDNLRNAVRYLCQKVKRFKAIESRGWENDDTIQILQTDLLPIPGFIKDVYLDGVTELNSALFAYFFSVEGAGNRSVLLDANQFHMESRWFAKSKVTFEIVFNKNSVRPQTQNLLTDFVSQHLSDLIRIETLSNDIKLYPADDVFLRTCYRCIEPDSDRIFYSTAERDAATEKWAHGVSIRCDNDPKWPERVQVLMHKYLEKELAGRLVQLKFEGDFDEYSQLQQAHAGASRRWNYCIYKSGWWDTEAKRFGSPNGITRLPVASEYTFNPPCLQIDLVIGKDGKKIIDVQSPWPEAKVLELTKAAGLDVKPWPGAFCDRWLE